MNTYNDHLKNLLKRNNQLLRNIKKNLPELRRLLRKIKKAYGYGDMMYRFYHQSLKVYNVQKYTEEMIDALKKCAPKDVVFNSYFEQIFKEGTGKKFNFKHNEKWLKHTRPMVEAFFHAKFFLEAAVEHGSKLKRATHELSSSWAALLYFYSMR
jgi:hypothetical protein